MPVPQSLPGLDLPSAPAPHAATITRSCASGAGRCHTDRSGFWGPWTYGENAFSNDYFVFLLEKKWTQKKTHNGKPWTGPKQFEADGGAP